MSKMNKLAVGMLLACASTTSFAGEKVLDMKGIEARTTNQAHVGAETASAESTPALISEADMSIEMLERLFKSAFFKTTLMGENRLAVQLSADRSAIIDIDRQHKLLFFYKVFGFKKQAAVANRVDLSNRINNGAILVRASVPEDDSSSLVIDYCLSYEETVLAFQVVNGVRSFSDVASKAVSQFDREDIVE